MWEQIIEDLNKDLQKLQKCVTCVICLDMLFEPYSFQCGHVFCYTVRNPLSFILADGSGLTAGV